jgi:hypothetical protein
VGFSVVGVVVITLNVVGLTAFSHDFRQASAAACATTWFVFLLSSRCVSFGMSGVVDVILGCGGARPIQPTDLKQQLGSRFASAPQAASS